jgi:sugar lactone lactonase YvrE
MKTRLFIAYFIVSAGLTALAGSPITGVITTFAGNGTAGAAGDGGPATSAQLAGIMGIAVDTAGNLYIADEDNDLIRKVTPDGLISTAVGASAGLHDPSDVAVDAAGNIYIADFNRGRVAKVTPGGVVSSIAGIAFPSAIAADPAGNVYVTDSWTPDDVSSVYRITADGALSIITTGLEWPSGLALDSEGNLYIADARLVLKVDAAGHKSILAGCGCDNGALGDGGPATSAQLSPSDVAVDGTGNIYIAEGSRIRMVTPAGIISTVAGNGKEGFSGDGGPAISAQLKSAYSVAVDPAGNLFIGDRGNRRIRKVVWSPGSETYFPHVAVGGGYYTTFSLSNTGDSAISGDLILTDQQGEPLTVSGTGLGVGSSFPISIAPAGTMFLTANPVGSNDPVRSGWARIVTVGGVINGVATFHLMSGGVRQAATGVLPSQPMRYATIPVDDDYSQERLTAYAIANPTSDNLSIKLALAEENGTVADDTVTITLAPKQQIARYLYQDLARSQFKGSIVLRAQGGGSFVAVALMQHQKMFTVIPVIPGKASKIPD